MQVRDIQKIIEEKVLGVWVAEHTIDGHFYRNTKTNKIVSSVTTQSILEKPHLIPWAAEIAVRYFIERMAFYDPKNIEQSEQLIKNAKLAFRDVRDDAGDVGTVAHDSIENFFKEWISTTVRPDCITKFIPDGSDPRVWAAVRSIEDLLSKFKNIQPVATELLVGSNKVCGAGTLDFLLLIDGELWIWDWKTSNQVSDPYAIQVSAYKSFWEEMTGLKVKGTAIIWLSKNFAKVKIYDIPYMNHAYAAFKNQGQLYKWLHNGKPKLIERKNRLVIK